MYSAPNTQLFPGGPLPGPVQGQKEGWQQSTDQTPRVSVFKYPERQVGSSRKFPVQQFIPSEAHFPEVPNPALSSFQVSSQSDLSWAVQHCDPQKGVSPWIASGLSLGACLSLSMKGGRGTFGSPEP